MIYREAGQFRTSYAADQAVFPIRQDRFFVMPVSRRRSPFSSCRSSPANTCCARS